MKSRIIRQISKAALFAAALLAICFSASTASAQDFKGKFTLPFSVRWGKAVLSPGDYQLTIDNSPGVKMLVLRDARSLRCVAFERASVREGSSKGASALLVGRQGTQWVVYSLRVAELGDTFVYQRPPAQARPFEEAGQTQTVAVLVTK